MLKLLLTPTLALAAAIAVSANSPPAPTDEPPNVAAGPFAPAWESLTKNYRTPEWFRDAKFGIWAHWSAQCVPEQGDWYAEKMYHPGDRAYQYHVAHYGHPSKFGFMEIDNLWKAEHWEPEKLMALYRRAGAKYFVALANHHDNFDAYNSKYHEWNSMNVGPKQDIVGGWSKAARAQGLKFGVSNHSSHAWHWLQAAYAYDAEGPMAGVRYDAFHLTKADGKGKWWDGLDPQELYTGPQIVMPDGIATNKAAAEWREKNNPWTNERPENNPQFIRKFFLRTQDLIDQYQPDLLYFDNASLPLGQTGLDLAAHYYNASLGWHHGRMDVVLNAKKLKPEQRSAVVEDIERGGSEGIRAEPWQTDTCIGAWHYDRDIFTQHKYKTAEQVVRLLADIVSKNGNLLLSVPLRGDGTLDADEEKFLDQMGSWMTVNGESIYGTRPWKIYGEGPSTTEKVERNRHGGTTEDRTAQPYTPADFRFTTKGDALYAIAYEWPVDGKLRVKALAHDADRAVKSVKLLGATQSLAWHQSAQGLEVILPATKPCDYAYVLKIE